MRSPFRSLESVYLDLTRFGLATLVLVAHLSQEPFGSSLPQDLTGLATMAVGGFFVLSGYTIAAIEDGHHTFTPVRFMVDRFSRLWSIALPALIWTALLDAMAVRCDPVFYHQWQTDIPLQALLRNALFSAQSWGANISPLSRAC